MDPIMAEKLQAMNNYKKGQFLNKLILHFFTALICTLFCSYPFWFPQTRLFMIHFVFVSIPNFKSFLFTPKCLFIVGNAIVAILVVESKLTAGSSHSSRGATNIYDEYVERSQSLRGAASKHIEKKEERKEDVVCLSNEESVNKIEEVKHMVCIEKAKPELIVDKKDDDATADDDDHKEEEEEEEEEEEPGLPAEELNKRVEEFIARVNKQRWLEEKLFVFGN